MRKLLFILLVIPGLLSAQNYRTDQAGGNWGTATSWEVFSGGSWVKLESTAFPTPTSASGSILIQNNISIAASVTADQVTINSGITLTISGGQTFTIADGSGNDLVNNGTITTTGTLAFNSNSTYEHARDGGAIPLATWGANSTCYITGIQNTNPTLNPLNAYQNFVWECTQAGTRSLAGNLRTVNGDLIINETGDQELRFAAGQTYNLTIGGDFLISGTSVVAFGTNANPVNINLTGDFDFSSTSLIDSQFKTSGVYNFTVGGTFSQSSGLINLSSGANTGTINVKGDFSQASGTLTRTGGTGLIALNGTAGSQNISVAGTLSSTVNFDVTNTAGVSLATDLVLPSNLTQASGAGIFDLNGFTLTINGSLTQTSGTFGVNTTSQLVLQGSGTLAGSLEFTGTDLFRLELNQTGTITSTSSVAITNLNLFDGTLTSTTLSMATGGLITRSIGSLTNSPGGTSYNVLYTNASNISTGGELPTVSTVLNNLEKQGNGTTTLTGLPILTINGNLTLTAGTFASGTNDINLVGNFISNSTFTASAGATFTFQGLSSTLTGSTSPTFSGLSVVNGTFTPSIDYRVNGNYGVGPGATVNPGGVTVIFGGTTVITNSGTMNLHAVTINGGSSMTAPATTMGISGNFTSTGTFNNGGGTILFNGVSDLTAPETYNNITVTGTVTSIGSFNVTVIGNVINNGSFAISSVSSRGNLSWLSSGTFSGTGTATVGDLNVNGTSFTYTALGNLTILDDILGIGTFNSSSSPATVILAGTGARLAGTGSKTFGNLSVTGTLTPAVSYSVTGNMNIDGTLVSGSTVTFAGATQSITGSGTSIAYNLFNTNVGSVLTINPNITINGNLNGNGDITSLGTITFVSLTLSGSGAKNFNNVIVGTGTLTTSSNYSVAGSLIVNGTLAAGSGDATFNGATTVFGAGNATFNDLSITGSLTARLSSEPALTVNGNFTNGGTFNGSSGTISLAGDLINNGNFNGNTGTFIFNTTNSAASRTISGSNSLTFHNLTIFNKGIATDVSNQLSTPLIADLSGALSFGEVNSFFDADGGGTSIFRIVSTNDNPATEGRVAPITFTGCGISGDITVQRFVSAEATQRFYRYIASPVVGGTVAQLQASGLPVTGVFADPSTCSGCLTLSPSMFSFTETKEPPYMNSSTVKRAYDAFPSAVQNSSEPLVNGDGYSAFFRQDLTGNLVLSFRGTYPSTGPISLPVAPTTTAGDGGYSLVGNPYPSPIIWGATGWTRSGIADQIVVRDNATGVHQSHGTADNFIIAPGQSFWVQSTSNGASLSIDETAKGSGSYEFYRQSAPIVDQVEFLLTKATTGTTANARVVILPQSSQAYDSFDSFVFDNSLDNGTTVTQVQDISSLSSDAKALGVNSIPAISCGQQFNLRVTNFVNTGEGIVNYSLQINPTGALKAMTWMLRDNYTNSNIDVTSNPTYNFTVNNAIAASRATNRFALTAVSATSIDVSKSVSAPSNICAGSEAVITVASQPGVVYSANVNGVVYKNLANGTGSDMPIFIDNDKLTIGSNTISLIAGSGCDQQTLSTVVQITKMAPAEVSSVTNGSLCQPGSVTLVATSGSSGATFNWYNSQNSSTPIATGAEFITPIITDSTTYYVAAVNGCEGSRVATYVKVLNTSNMITVGETYPVCKGESVTLSASSITEDGSFNWYNSTSVTPIATGTELTIPNLNATTTYFVSYVSPTGCESARVAIEAQAVSYTPSLQVLRSTEVVCSNQKHILTVTGAAAGGTYQWFDSQTNTIPLLEGDKLITENLVTSKDFFVRSVSALGCVSDKFSVTALVDEGPLNSSLAFSYDKICREDATTISITSPTQSGIKYRWYASADSTEPISEGSTFSTSVIADNTSYFVSSVNQLGCESIVRKQVTVEVQKYAEPKIDFSVSGQLKSNFAVGNQWYLNNETLSGETNQNIAVKQSGDYDLKVSSQGCEEFAGAVNITLVITDLEERSQEISIYPNPVGEILKIKVEGQELPVTTTLIDQRGITIEELKLNRINEFWQGEFDVRALSSGIYFLKITSGSKSITHKVIVK